MSEGQKTRRRFLADILFLGGALGAASFLMQADGDAAPRDQPTPQATVTPDPSSQCPPQIDGETVAPSPPPQTKGERLAPSPPEPAIEGNVVAPQLKGDRLAPQPSGEPMPARPPTER